MSTVDGVMSRPNDSLLIISVNAGLRVVYNVSRPPFDRVVSVDVLSTDALKPKYEPLKVNETYKVIVSSFFVKAGDNFTMIRDHMENHRYVFRILWKFSFIYWRFCAFLTSGSAQKTSMSSSITPKTTESSRQASGIASHSSRRPHSEWFLTYLFSFIRI